MLSIFNEREHVISHYKPHYLSLKNTDMIKVMLSIIKNDHDQPFKAMLSIINECGLAISHYRPCDQSLMKINLLSVIIGHVINL